MSRKSRMLAHRLGEQRNGQDGNGAAASSGTERPVCPNFPEHVLEPAHADNLFWCGGCGEYARRWEGRILLLSQILAETDAKADFARR